MSNPQDITNPVALDQQIDTLIAQIKFHQDNETRLREENYFLERELEKYKALVASRGY